MASGHSSINQLQSLVEKLASLTAEAGLDTAPCGLEQALAAPVAGRPLAEQAAELWPQAGDFVGPALCAQVLGEEREDLRERIRRLEEEIAGKRSLLARGARRLAAERQALAIRAADAEAAAARARALVRRLGPEIEAVAGRVREVEARALALGRWLEGLAPRGMAGFRDARGQQVSERQARQAQESMNRLLAQGQSLRARAAEIRQGRERAESRARAAVVEAAAARRAADGFMAGQAGRLAALKRAETQLAARRDELARVQRRSLRLIKLGMVHADFLAEVAQAVEPLLAEPPLDPAAALEPARQAEENARYHGGRAERLSGLLARLERRLIPAADAVTEQIKRAREANKEIKALEGELPALVEPLTHRDKAGPDARGKAAVGLSMVLARVEELLPRAGQVQAQLEELRGRLRLGSARGRRWQEAWREAGRAERSQLDAARALAAEAIHGAEQARAQCDRQTEELAPLAEALARVPALEALPSLAAAVQTIIDARAEAARLRRGADRLEQGLGQPSAGNLARPPAAIKPFTAAARRLAGKDVNLEGLRALGRAVERWRELLAEPLFENARRQAEEVALSLGKSLAAMAAERQQLLAARGRSAGLLRGLRRDLIEQRQQGKAIARRLADAQERGRRQERRLAEFERQIAATRGELARAIETQRLQAKENVELRGELDTVRGHANRQAEELSRQRRELERTRQELGASRQAHAEERARAEIGERDLSLARSELNRARRELRATQGALGQARHQRSTVVKSYRAEHARGLELSRRLDEAERQVAVLGRRLARHSALSAALKVKSLERHGLLREARRALAELEDLQRVTLARESELDRARAELDQARHELGQARQELRTAVAERDRTAQALAAEQAARARQALDLLQGQALSVELAATQSEAGRWANLAADLSAALAAAGMAHERETATLRGQIESLASEAEVLKAQLSRIAGMVSSAEVSVPAPPPSSAPRRGPAPPRQAALTTEQVDRTLERVQSLRRRLRGLGRSALGHWALIAALTSSLLLVAPNTPSKATRAEAPLKAPRLAVPRAMHDLNMGPVLDLPVAVASLPGAMGSGRVEVNLLPLRPTKAPLPESVRRQVERLAARAGLSPQVLVTSARALFAGQAAVEPEALKEVADIARSLSRRHPLIFRELASKGLPPTAAALAAVDPAPEKAQQLFLDRLFAEYRNLGFSAEEALGALAANERAVAAMNRLWTPPARYWGKVKPVQKVEAMNLPHFLARMKPYIISKLKIFLKQRGMTYSGDLDRYARNLAFDMYCAAKKYHVPVTFLLVIAHQETWYANVLGDVGRSASPFQIFEPTRHLIRLSMEKHGLVPPPEGVRLQHHLTMATYMAAFHLRELMAESVIPARRGRRAMINMDKVLKRYNGSSRYSSMVAVRRNGLAESLN